MTYFHEEQRFGQPWIIAILVMVAVGIGIALASDPSVSPLGVAVAIMTLVLVVALFFAVELVTEVDRDAVTISFRFLWPTRRVRIEDIDSYEAVRYRPLIDYLGYGVRFGPKGLAYNVSGDRGVKIGLRRGGSFLIGSQRAEELADAIGRAKAAG